MSKNRALQISLNLRRRAEKLDTASDNWRLLKENVYLDYPIEKQFGAREKIDLFVKLEKDCYFEAKYIRPTPSGAGRPFPQYRGSLPIHLPQAPLSDQLNFARFKFERACYTSST
jgi:hypothetical protein